MGIIGRTKCSLLIGYKSDFTEKLGESNSVVFLEVPVSVAFGNLSFLGEESELPVFSVPILAG